MKSLARLVREKEEREARRAEKERLKKEKEAEKLRLKKIEKKKKQKKGQNQRYYKKKRDKELAERKKMGDMRTYHLVLITKNYKRKKRIGASWWMTDAYAIYNEAIEKNQQEVKFPAKIFETSVKRQKQSERSTANVYEIMILQRTPEGQTVNQFKDESGKFVDNIIINNESYTILDKHEWLIEETFNVYGYHPSKDRKTFDFILNEMVMKDVERENIKRVFTFANKLIIQYDDDIDIVTCKTEDEAIRLHNALDKAVGKNKYILFTGKLNRNMSTWILNKLEEKTGWTRESCKKIHTL